MNMINHNDGWFGLAFSTFNAYFDKEKSLLMPNDLAACATINAYEEDFPPYCCVILGIAPAVSDASDDPDRPRRWYRFFIQRSPAAEGWLTLFINADRLEEINNSKLLSDFKQIAVDFKEMLTRFPDLNILVERGDDNPESVTASFIIPFENWASTQEVEASAS